MGWVTTQNSLIVTVDKLFLIIWKADFRLEEPIRAASHGGSQRSSCLILDWGKIVSTCRTMYAMGYWKALP
ncbi:hypothetical protein CASFOL_035687 [Castilleja foliolosa]|uniref:Uncharacterized protein n=1 Tax=Castilleja foliolosa TaxID=1961234 RepID=A0ABD3BTC8_9LAMI